MKSIEIVEENYLITSTEVRNGKIQRRIVRPGSGNVADIEIKTNLPKLFEGAIAETGRSSIDYRIYGSVGQINWYLAKIPWVAALQREVTTSTERGYYIVLLFREDMLGCVLSLNQGYTQYYSAYGQVVSKRKVEEGATVALSYLEVPVGFVGGPIELNASGDLGIGYERGAILSKVYSTTERISPDQFKTDLALLLHAYDALRKKIGSNIIDALPPISEDDFQEAAASLGKDKSVRAQPPGPVARPPRSTRPAGSGYPRNPAISGQAIANAHFQCAVDTSHTSFISKTTNRNFVEAHHLVPMQYQDDFEVSLDVPENIIVVCPTCHRKLHHGLARDKLCVLKNFFATRSLVLQSRGIELTLEQLLNFYRSTITSE